MEFVQNDLCFEVINETKKTVQVKGTQALTTGEPRSIIIPATIVHENVEYKVVAIGGKFRYNGVHKYWKEDKRRSGGGDWEKRYGDHLVSGLSNTKIQQITIPNTITSIESCAFRFCEALCFITIPKSVKKIGDRAFENCLNLNVITIISDDITIGENAFAGTRWMQNQSSSGAIYLGNILLKGDSSGTIKEGTICIGDSAFYCREALTSITIPNSVTSIGSRAFEDCKSLTSITIPSSVTSIGESAFHGCYALTSITIPNSVTSIGESAFSWCCRLTSITIPSSVTSIGACAFYGCSALTSITIPNSVTSIGGRAFSDCEALTSITIPNSVTSIGATAFYDCKALTSITIPNSVTSIGASAFYGCSNIETIIIQNTPENIELPWQESWVAKVQFVGASEIIEQPVIEEDAQKKQEEPIVKQVSEAPGVAAMASSTPHAPAPTIDLEKLIAAALIDGVVTDKERSILCKKVKETGGDVDEFELLLDARIYEAQQKNNTIVEVAQTALKEEPKTETPKEVINQSAIPTIEQKKHELTISNIATPEQPKSVSPTTTQTRNRDKANYVFNGKVYTKKVQLVQDLVLHHLSLHPDLTHEQLKKDFQVQKNMDVMFMSYEMYLSTLAEKGIVYFFESKTEEDTIALQDAKILISSNWPTMVGGKPSVFAKLLDKAKELGYEITVQE